MWRTLHVACASAVRLRLRPHGVIYIIMHDGVPLACVWFAVCMSVWCVLRVNASVQCAFCRDVELICQLSVKSARFGFRLVRIMFGRVLWRKPLIISHGPLTHRTATFRIMNMRALNTYSYILYSINIQRLHYMRQG